VAKVTEASLGWVFDWVDVEEIVEWHKQVEYVVLFDVSDQCDKINLDERKVVPDSLALHLYVKSMSAVHQRIRDEEHVRQPWISFQNGTQLSSANSDFNSFLDESDYHDYFFQRGDADN